MPSDAGNSPYEYLDPGANARSDLLVRLLSNHACDTASTILEIGCNAGRNLHHLWCAGYKNLTEIEISQEAVEVLRREFSGMAEHIDIVIQPVEEMISAFRDGEFDVVFTMAVLEHIHPDSEWIFPEIARITRSLLITIEDEQGEGLRHFARNYRRVFVPLGFTQSEAFSCSPDLEGLSSAFVARIFKKRRVRNASC